MRIVWRGASVLAMAYEASFILRSRRGCGLDGRDKPFRRTHRTCWMTRRAALFSMLFRPQYGMGFGEFTGGDELRSPVGVNRN